MLHTLPHNDIIFRPIQSNFISELISQADKDCSIEIRIAYS
jgi:hypothetical protein